MALIDDFHRQWTSPEAFIEAHTSGSTGEPKTIKLSKDDMRLSARATNARFGIRRESVLASPLSLDYIAGKMMCVRAWEAECRLIELPVSNHFTLPDDVIIDLLAIVPTQVDCLVEQKDIAEHIRHVIVGGAPLSAERTTRLIGCGIDAYVSYGMTETCSHVALAKVGSRLYQAMPGISFEIDNRDCLVINAEAYSFKRLVTNDIVRLVDNCSFEWIGRYDNVINSGGIKLAAEDLEHEISGIFPDLKFYIVGIDDRHWGEVPVLVFEGSSEQITNIMAKLSAAMDHRRLPKMAKAVDSLPLTSNGKIKRILPEAPAYNIL